MSNDTDKVQLIKQLRQATNAPVSTCREAADVCDGDFDEAVKFIHKKVKPPKPAEERAGRITAHVHNGRIGVLIEVRCATDFAANTEQFQTLCKELALQVIGVGDEDLLDQPYVRDPSQRVKELIGRVCQQLGEPISVKRVVRWELQ